MAVAAVTPELMNYAKSRNPEPPRRLGTRYDRGGTFLPEPGNTVVCHLVEGSETERALVEARQRYLAMPEAPQLAFTPVSSLHMTLFQGVIEYRRSWPYWPRNMATDSSIRSMTEHYAARLANFAGGPSFRVHAVKALPTGIVVEGVSDKDRLAMLEWRDRFADLFGYRHPDHESYEFHITFAYIIEYLADDALPAWQAMLDDVADAMRSRVDFLELRPPAFCSFEDMNHFEELRAFNFVL
jgi:hypothetical protein